MITGTPEQEEIARIFKALGDPVRLNIVTQIAEANELPFARLVRIMNMSKSSISYHTKVLQQAGLISSRKQGRHYYFTVRRDVLREMQDELLRLARAPHRGARGDFAPAPRSADRPAIVKAAEVRRGIRLRLVTADEEAVVLTW